ncbi:MAG: DUF4345 domain-containing protein [Polyangiaceae bacterium]|nr:DUF4345 domain-containing protein [Polyangiaceae bacterium]
MDTKTYNTALVAFFAFNAMIWVPWGLFCLFVPEAWSGAVIPGMKVFDLSQAVARTEVRAMYGGLQIAIGLLAVIAIIKPVHRDTSLLFFVLALTGLALSRLSGIILEGSDQYFAFTTNVTPENYNQVGLGMYEFHQFICAWSLYVMKPSKRTEALTTEAPV